MPRSNARMHRKKLTEVSFFIGSLRTDVPECAEQNQEVTHCRDSIAVEVGQASAALADRELTTAIIEVGFPIEIQRFRVKAATGQATREVTASVIHRCSS